MIDNQWIHDTDLPEIPDPVCPICGSEMPEYIYLQNGAVIGCVHCLECMDADDWAADQWEQEREADIEEELERRIDR